MNTKIIIGLITLLFSCHIVYGQKSKTKKNIVRARLELSYTRVNDTSSNKLTLPNDDKALRANTMKIWKQQGYGKGYDGKGPVDFDWPVNLDKCICIDLKDYDSIFSPDLLQWREINIEWARFISSTGAISVFDGYFWQFNGNGNIKFVECYRMKEKKEANKIYGQVPGTYRFDKNNSLLYIRWKESKQTRELVLKVNYYQEKEQDHIQEILVLHAFPQATWNMPVKEILKRNVVYYDTFIRSKITEVNEQ